MEAEHGVVGRLLAHGVLDRRLPPLWESRPEDFPLAGEVLSLATGVVVHSRYVEERDGAAGLVGAFARVPHPAWPDPGVEPAELGGEPLIGAFGNVNQSKRVPQLLEAFARLRADHPGARLLLVGATSPGFDLERRLQRLGLDGDGIVREHYVDEPRLWRLMTACDVHVNLRSPTMGETSGTAVRALALGKPLVVSDVGWFAELPRDVALAVPVGEREVDDLAAALRLLAERRDVRDAMGAAARALARSDHDLGRVAELQAAAFERVAGGSAVDAEVLREVSEAAASVGIAPGSAEASEIARGLSELGG
jgi:glycosyltransferase involved in cell wall biosynthesis